MLGVCKKNRRKYTNEMEDMPHYSEIPRFSKLKVIVLCLTTQSPRIGNKNFLFTN